MEQAGVSPDMPPKKATFARLTYEFAWYRPKRKRPDQYGDSETGGEGREKAHKRAFRIPRICD
jgi:hypothetical protein